MSDKNTNKLTTQYEFLRDLELLSLWSQSGRDWTSTIKEEIRSIEC